MEQELITARFSEQIHPLSTHFHDCYQLIYVVEGNAFVTVNGNQYEATPGTMLLIGRFENHGIQIQSEKYARYTVTISPNIYGYNTLLGDRLLSPLANRPKHFRHAVDVSCHAEVDQILQQMVEESKQMQPMKDKMLLFLLSQLLVLYSRQHPEAIPDHAGNLELIRQVRQYLEDNYAAKCDLDSLASRFNLSASYLSHIFKQITGCSVISYLTAYRISAAKHYLIETDWPISSICAACGFSDHSNFGRTFRSETGLSPSAFRAKFSA